MPVLRRMAETVRASLNSPNVPLTDASLADWLNGANGPRVLSGVSVSEQSAMRLIAVYRCVELIAGTCAALPLKAYRNPDRVEISNLAISDPHPELTRFEVWEIAYACLLLWGNAYFRKLRDGAGRIRYLWPIHPSRIDVDIVDPTPGNPGGKVFAVIDKHGRKLPYTSYEILHIPGIGYDGRKGLSRIQLARQALGLGMAAEEYAARFFGSGQLMAGILTTDQVLTEPQAIALKNRWKQKVSGLAKAHDVAVLDSGAKFQPVSIPPSDAQLLEEQKWSVVQIARLFGMPPHLVGDVEKSTSWGTGIESQTIGMVKFTIQPSYLTRVEQRLTKEVLLASTDFAEYEVDGLLRGDTAARYDAHAKGRQWGLETLNDFNKLENKPTVDDPIGDAYLVPAGYSLITKDGTVLVAAKGAMPTEPAAPAPAPGGNS